MSFLKLLWPLSGVSTSGYMWLWGQRLHHSRLKMTMPMLMELGSYFLKSHTFVCSHTFVFFFGVRSYNPPCTINKMHILLEGRAGCSLRNCVLLITMLFFLESAGLWQLAYMHLCWVILLRYLAKCYWCFCEGVSCGYHSYWHWWSLSKAGLLL